MVDKEIEYIQLEITFVWMNVHFIMWTHPLSRKGGDGSFKLKHIVPIKNKNHVLLHPTMTLT